jgi:hypothetical protein
MGHILGDFLTNSSGHPDRRNKNKSFEAIQNSHHFFGRDKRMSSYAALVLLIELRRNH